MKNIKKEFAYKLLSRQLNESEDYCKKIIMLGKVFLNFEKNLKLTNISEKLPSDQLFYVKDEKKPFVSRGGEKLSHALKFFNILPGNKNCLDVGSSTGGFTDCLLQNNAQLVYAVDAGTNQLDYKIRINKKVVVKENYNFRYAKSEDFAHKVDLATIDVSFISIKKIIIPLKSLLASEFDIICLIKPQFEAQKEEVSEGLIKDLNVHVQIIKDFVNFCEENSLHVQNITFSPITGLIKNNIEYFIHISNKPSQSSKIDITSIVKEAWATLYE